jgi:hypothetical protein
MDHTAMEIRHLRLRLRRRQLRGGFPEDGTYLVIGNTNAKFKVEG